MSELRQLYQEMIVDHSKRPRNFRKILGANRIGEGFNPLCGDKVQLYLTVEDDIIVDIAFEGAGCAISTASASMMTEGLKSKTVNEAFGILERFHDLVTGRGVDAPDSMGKLAVFSGVSEFPARVKCASLPWHTLKVALTGGKNMVTTE